MDLVHKSLIISCPEIYPIHVTSHNHLFGFNHFGLPIFPGAYDVYQGTIVNAINNLTSSYVIASAAKQSRFEIASGFRPRNDNLLLAFTITLMLKVTCYDPSWFFES